MYSQITADQMRRDYSSAIFCAPKVYPDALIEKHAIEAGFTVEEFTGKKRTSDISPSRQECWRVLHEDHGFSLPWIGKRFSSRDHTTVLHGIRAAERRAQG